MESINVVVDNNLKEYVKKDLYNIIEIIEENSLKKDEKYKKSSSCVSLGSSNPTCLPMN
jgi:CRISPR/Cas system-associated exonuclease Cas4 (RecB family)